MSATSSGLERVLDLARGGRLYPSVILYGSSLEARKRAALEITRVLLCERPEPERPCDGAEGSCRHCRRLEWPGKDAERFHPDLHVLERDLRTSTSVDATKSFLGAAVASPFEARGQVFVIAEAESLTGGAADALLKMLEEPPARSPRHFFLLAASRLDLLTTLRSRSLSVYLGSPESLDKGRIDEWAQSFGQYLDGYFASGSVVYLLSAAETLTKIPGWDDPRARKPWALAASVVVRALEDRELESATRRRVLALAEALLGAARLRMRGITHVRILEGLLVRHLACGLSASL